MLSLSPYLLQLTTQAPDAQPDFSSCAHGQQLHSAAAAAKVPLALTLSHVGSCSGSTISGAFFLPFLAFGGIVAVRLAAPSSALEQQVQ